MNEKFKQYYDLGNDKSLIGQHTPTESELQEFDIWKEKKLANSKKGSILALFMIFLVMMPIIMNVLHSKNFDDDTFSVIIFSAFLFFIAFLVIKSNKSVKNCVLEYCDHGIIVDLVEKLDSDKDIDYYAIVLVNGNHLRVKVPFYIYSTLQINEEVTLYAISIKQKLLLTKRV